MSKGNALETQLLALLFNDVALPWSNAVLYIALHTADPGESGDQTANEVAFTGYARVAVPRDVTGWLVAGNQASNAAAIVFPECTAGAATVTHVSVGLAASGASQILYQGALNSPVAVAPSTTLRFPIGTLAMSED